MKNKDEHIDNGLEHFLDDSLDEGDQFLESCEKTLSDRRASGSDDNYSILVRPVDQYPSYTSGRLNDIAQVINAASNMSSQFVELCRVMADFQKASMELELKFMATSKRLDNELVREQNKGEVVKSGLDLIRNTAMRFLDNALLINDATCSDREFEMKHKVIDRATEQLNRATDLIMKYFESR